jgi:hypothetical protein
VLNKFEKYGLLIVCFLFIALYLLLAFNNRLTSDDFDFFALVNQNGWFGALKYMYFNWSGRWTSIAYFFIVLSSSSNLENISVFIFLYHLVSIILFIYSIYSILSSLLTYFFIETPTKTIRLTYAILFCAALYFSTFQNIEVWFWVCSSFCYLQMIIFSCLGFALMLSKRKFLLKHLLIALCFIFVGGSLETFSFTLLILFSILLFYLAKRHGFVLSVILKNSFFKSVLIAFSFLFISACLNYFAPGNFKRKQHELIFVKENPEFKSTNLNQVSPQKNNGMINSAPAILKLFITTKYFAFYILLLPWVLLGVKLRFERKVKFNFPLKKMAIVSLLLLLLFLAINAGASLAIFGNGGPLRSWMSFNFLTTIILCFWCIVLGYKFSIFSKYRNRLLFISVFSLFATMCFYIYKQYPLVTKYSVAYDNRINYLNELRFKNYRDTLIELKPLPEPGMLVGDNIVGIERALHLKFKVRITEE